MARRLSIVGLGPGDPVLRSVAAQELLTTAPIVILRTAIHPGVDQLLGRHGVTSCDDLYESSGSFDELYAAISQRVLDALERVDVVYAVPGSPVAGERTVCLLRDAAMDQGIEVELVPSVGGLDLIAAATCLDLMADGVQVLDAVWLGAWTDQQPFNGALLDISPYRPAIVTQVYKAELAVAAQLALGTVFPETHVVHLARWSNPAGSMTVEPFPLSDLDRADVDHLTSLVVPAMPKRTATRSPFTLFETVARLRAPDGCPWDREQSHESLVGALIEEAFEAVDAIENADDASMADELGDLLLQPVMQAQIAAERGAFDIGDVLDSVSSKLVRRHPHVFGDASASTPDEVLTTWNRVKASERGTPQPTHPYAKLPRSMPASRKLQRAKLAGGSSNGVNAEQLALEVAERMIALARTGEDIDGLVDRACLILLGLDSRQTARRDTT